MSEIKPMFANAELEERMLSGKSRSEAMAAAVYASVGTEGQPKNPTEIMIDSCLHNERNPRTIALLKLIDEQVEEFF